MIVLAKYNKLIPSPVHPRAKKAGRTCLGESFSKAGISWTDTGTLGGTAQLLNAVLTVVSYKGNAQQ